MNKYRLVTVLLVFCSLVFPASVGAVGAKLEFRPKNINVRPGETEEVFLNLDTGGIEVMGVDVFMEYDSSILRIVDVTNLGIFSNETAKDIDNNGGLVKYALSNSWGKYQSEKADVAKLVIEGISEKEKTELTFMFTQGDTTDTNVVAEHGQDVLESVNTLTVKVKKGAKENDDVLGSETTSSDSSDGDGVSQGDGDEVGDEEVDDAEVGASDVDDDVREGGQTVERVFADTEGELSEGGKTKKVKPIEGLVGEVAGVLAEKNNSIWIFLLVLFVIVLVAVTFVVFRKPKNEPVGEKS